MVNELERWLPHLRDSIPKEAYGYPLSMYTIALEGWKRGLTLKFINNNKFKSVIGYSLSDGKKEHRFMGSRGDLVTNEAIKVCRNKFLTKKYLSKAEVSIPGGEYFSNLISDDEIIKFANSLGYPIVIKPTTGAGGRGVIANIKNEEEFKDALYYVRHDLNYQEIIVEQYFDGEDYRVFVIGDKVIGAVQRIPANVIGDGKSTIRQLLNSKIKEKRKNPALTGSPIKIDKEMHTTLHQKGYTLEGIPSNGERVFLKTKSNISAGGDPIDVTDMLTEEIKQNAVKAIHAIPGLVQGGVDIIFNKRNRMGVILELNTLPSIRTHLFPLEGQARDIPKAIIDYYFPETDSNDSKPRYYFDIAAVFETFNNRTTEEILIPARPKGSLSSFRLKVYGIERVESYKRQVQKHAKSFKLHGYVKKLEKNAVTIIISGLTDDVDKFRNIIKNNNVKLLKAKKVIEDTWDKPIRIGFHIADNKKQTKAVNKPRKKQKKNISLEEYNKVLEELELYKQKYKEIQNSTSWKITRPIRNFRRSLRSSDENE